MQQFRPIPSFQRFDNVDVIEEEQVVEKVSFLQPDLASPHSVIADRIAEITTERLAAISGITPEKTGALSLTDALRSTLSPNPNGRRLFIPVWKKLKLPQYGSAQPI